MKLKRKWRKQVEEESLRVHFSRGDADQCGLLKLI